MPPNALLLWEPYCNISKGVIIAIGKNSVNHVSPDES